MGRGGGYAPLILQTQIPANPVENPGSAHAFQENVVLDSETGGKIKYGVPLRKNFQKM